MNTTTCNRCDGTGTIQAFNHYAAGVCFACAGAGEVKASTGDVGTSAAKARKVIDVDGVAVTVWRDGRGYRADDVTGCVWFDLVGRELRNVIASDAIRRDRVSRIVSTLRDRCTA